VNSASCKAKESAVPGKQQSEGNVSGRPAERIQLALCSAVQDSTVGVALFDETLRCILSNSALLNMRGLQPNECIGKTVRELFGRQARSLHRAIRIVAGNKKTLRNIIFLMAAEKKEAQHWVADVFPFHDDQKPLLWIGVAFCELPPGNILQNRLLHLAHSGNANGSGRIRSDKRKSEVAATHDRILKRAVTVLDSSMSLRRNITGLRIAATLSREGWPNIAGETMELTNHPLSRQQNGNGHPERNQERIVGMSPSLSSRELDVVRFLSDGKSNKEIACELNLSTRTVETYRARLMNKLELHSTAELIRYALRNHLIPL
jgi:DNA-binding CsgD family transcriptional regulator